MTMMNMMKRKKWDNKLKIIASCGPDSLLCCIWAKPAFLSINHDWLPDAFKIRTFQSSLAGWHLIALNHTLNLSWRWGGGSVQTSADSYITPMHPTTTWKTWASSTCQTTTNNISESIKSSCIWNIHKLHKIHQEYPSKIRFLIGSPVGC